MNLAPLCYQFPDQVIWSKNSVRKNLLGIWTCPTPRFYVFQNEGPIVSLSGCNNHRILHHLLGKRTNEMIRNGCRASIIITITVTQLLQRNRFLVEFQLSQVQKSFMSLINSFTVDIVVFNNRPDQSLQFHTSILKSHPHLLKPLSLSLSENKFQLAAMAKSGVYEGDPVMVAKAVELKRELQRLVRTIVEDDDINCERIDKAHKTLLDLRELKLNKKSVSLKKLRNGDGGDDTSSTPVPDHFLCPLSKQMMKDPVIVATGQTYDRPFILKYIKSGSRTCPSTQQVLSHTILTPNHLIRELIAQWCKTHGVKFPEPAQYTEEEGLTESDREHFLSLVEKMSSTLPNQIEAAKKLRQLTKKTPSFRALFGENATAIPQLLSPLSQSQSKSEIHQNLQEDIITTLLNLSIHDNNKKLVAETPSVIPLLLDALKSGTIETRSNAAATLFTLSAIDSNKALIGKSGAFKPLIVLLEEAHPLAMKDVASAIFNLCILQENRARAIADGAVEVILNKIISRVHVDELLAILAMLSTSQRAIEEMSDLGAVPCLLSIIRETPCPRNKENCIAILYSICYSDPTKWKEMKEDENKYKTISQLAENGTSRAKRKAHGILDRLRRIASRTHTA